MQLVREQLAAFRGDMERDGAAQCAQARRLITGAAQRATRLVDATLQATPIILPSCCADPIVPCNGQCAWWTPRCW